MAVSIFNSLFNLIVDVPVDTKMAELHTLNATPSTFALEDGTTVTDHIVLNPDTVEIPFIMSNIDTDNTVYGLRAATAYQLLRQRLGSRELYSVVTRHNLYNNMALISAPAQNTAPLNGQLIGSAKFQRIPQAGVNQVVNQVDQFAQDGTQQSAANTINRGTQVTSDLSNDAVAGTYANNTFGG